MSPPTCSPKGRIYDSVFLASTYRLSAVPQTIFNERGLALVALPWPWAVTLKLARTLHEAGPGRLCYGAAFRRRTARQRHPIYAPWARAVDRGACAGFQPLQKQQLRKRIRDVLTRAFPPVSQGVCRYGARRARSRCISRPRYPPNSPACNVPFSYARRRMSPFLPCALGFSSSCCSCI